MDEKQLKEFINAIGTVAEITLIFYRDVLKAGGTREEALQLAQAFIAASIYGRNGEKKEDV